VICHQARLRNRLARLKLILSDSARGEAAHLVGSGMSRTPTPDPHLITDIEVFEDRVAVVEYDADLTRLQAENLAAQ
jgi:hypothetical protein